MKILITSGGTKVPIDGVRDITNKSNGTFGAKIAHEALEAGAEVVFFRARHSKTPFSKRFDFYGDRDWETALNQLADLYNFAEKHRGRYKEVGFRNFQDYNGPLHHLMLAEKPDIVILAAAVSDFLVSNIVEGKVRSEGDYQIDLEEAPKVISMVKTTMPDVFLVGFKLLVNSTQEELLDASWESVQSNGCDLVVANDLRDIQGAAHKVLLVREGPVREVIAELYQSPDDNLAKVVVEEAIRLWQKRESCSASPVA